MRLSEAYSILGLSEKADLYTIKTTYRSLAKKYHPDLSGQETTAEFIKMNRAYNLICATYALKQELLRKRQALKQDKEAGKVPYHKNYECSVFGFLLLLTAVLFSFLILVEAFFFIEISFEAIPFIFFSLAGISLLTDVFKESRKLWFS